MSVISSMAAFMLALSRARIRMLVRLSLANRSMAVVAGMKARSSRSMPTSGSSFPGPTGVIAKSVHCEDEPSGATVERKGTAGSVDLAAQRFVLTLSGGATLNVSWSGVTFFEDVTPATLAGQRLEVEGKLVDGVLVAKKIQAESEDD